VVSDSEKSIKEAFQILALSGGGYKGLFTAQIIAQIEERTGDPFGSHFDLICGTSVGGIIALALATREISAQEVVTSLKEAGPKIFTPIKKPSFEFGKPKTMGKSIADKKIFEQSGFTFSRGIEAAKHENKNLKDIIQKLFGNRKIEDLKTRVLIPTANWTKGAPQFFKTPHNPKLTVDKKCSLVDVAMATSAAPIYLPNYKFECQVYVDGGIVGNAPGIFGIHEAENFINEAKDKEHYLLSIGALSSKITANQSETLDKGLIQWNSQLFDFMMACQEQTADFMLKQKMGERYHMVDETTSAEQDKVIALDKAHEASTDTLLGLAKIVFQKEIAEQALNNHITQQTADLNFKI